MRIIVASTNPVKLRATEHGFRKTFAGEAIHVEGLAAESGVAHQPMSNEETLRGARNRAAHAQQLRAGADFWVGLEGGVYEREGTLEAFAWIVVLSTYLRGEARTATFELPPEVAQLVHQGMELGHADDQVFGRTNSKQSNGAVGLLTRDLITRTSYYEHAVMLALIPFVNPELYRAGE
jgi:inosine/xanthosine triphosphatase